MAKKKAAKKKARKMTYASVATEVVFANVQAALDDIVSDSNQPISASPHGAFWRNTTRDAFVGQYVNTQDPCNSTTFYIYLDSGIMPQGGYPGGKDANEAHPDAMKTIKTWLCTGFH